MMPYDDFPPTLLRGVPNKNAQFFDNQGRVTGNVFRPHDKQEPEQGFYKISINWEDDNTVEEFTLKEKLDDGSYHYRGGVVRLCLARINSMQREIAWQGSIEYNREPIPGVNDYHGNLLLKEEKVRSKINRRALLARLQLVIIKFIPPIE